MPYDGTNFETRPDVFSLDGLIAWLEKQPAEKKYCYMDTGACLLCQYLVSIGVPFEGVYGTYWDDANNVTHDIPASVAHIPVEYPRTFGAALSRARALRAS